ncbi:MULTISPECIES: DUF6510 family protein [Kitasatospora]|uniref:Uncharacterized protein n=1 Tax=Kitasatospora setae (strain ATCC 33774 / DSM 43861 / JCM 3304 / KCC A-0304 / NBRC 14216 / KM-6054) TaxID=452652 RepID=E4N551_KITSK|nr:MULTISPECIES: DUF6510 family protein [Kitasatospora]BAJ26332.1 hypothetical protein KSE_04860 [Kitasatospora setae KM-6054]
MRDGNALAGPLSELFVPDPTTALRLCPGCGADAALATLHVYDHGPAAVARCPRCTRLAFRIAHHPGELWFDFGHGGALRFPTA